MKTWTTFSKGLIAIALLSSVSCMDKGFQTLQSQVTQKNTDDQVSTPGGSYDYTPSQEAEDRPLASDDTPVVQDPAEQVEQPSDKTDTKNAEEPKPIKKGPRVAGKNPSVVDDKGTEPKTEENTEEKEEQKSATSSAEEPKKSVAVEEEKETEEPKKESATADKADFTGPGVLKPTIYYFPTFNEDELKCDKNSMMHATGGKDLLLVCEKTAKECGLQGSCAVIQNGVMRSFNVLGAKDGQDRFFEIKDECKYGFGVKSSCLDPFYTLAADLNIYQPGQVIFIPAVVGMKLPDGSKHTGYFVIRDRGRGVTGTGRFDFFSGMVAWRDQKNPFTKMGLGDVKTNIPYFKVKGKTAQLVLRHRAFPKLPRK